MGEWDPQIFIKQILKEMKRLYTEQEKKGYNKLISLFLSLLISFYFSIALLSYNSVPFSYPLLFHMFLSLNLSLMLSLPIAILIILRLLFPLSLFFNFL